MASATGTASRIRQRLAAGLSPSTGRKEGRLRVGIPAGGQPSPCKGGSPGQKKRCCGCQHCPWEEVSLWWHVPPHAAVLDLGHGETLAEPPPHCGSAEGPSAEHPAPTAPSAGPLSCSGMNWRLPTGCSTGMYGWSHECHALDSSLARPGLATSQGIPHPQPWHPSCLFPLRQHRQLSFSAEGKQVPEPRVMEPSGGWELKKHTPACKAAPFICISSHLSLGAWRKSPCR